MEWGILIALVAAFFIWRHSKTQEKAEAATQRLKQDNRLYQHIKTAKREYDWHERNQPYKRHPDGELLFENAHVQVYNVEHFAESRLGFYFKDTNEYGLYGFFAGNGDEFHESYYRTDRTFKQEGVLLYDDD